METTITQRRIEGRYWNANGKGIAIVASITNPIDWAAYIGAGDSEEMDCTEDCIKEVAEYGVKLSEKDARHFFPDIELPYRR